MSRGLFLIGNHQFEIDEQCRWFRVDGEIVRAKAWDALMEEAEAEVEAANFFFTPRAVIDPDSPIVVFTSNFPGPDSDEPVRVGVVDEHGEFHVAEMVAEEMDE